MPTVPKIQTSSKLEEKASQALIILVADVFSPLITKKLSLQDARMKETLRTPSFRRLSLLPPMPDLEEEIKKSSDNEEEGEDLTGWPGAARPDEVGTPGPSGSCLLSDLLETSLL